MRIILLSLLACSVLLAQETSSSEPASRSQKIWEPPFYNGTAAQVEKKLITHDDVRREMAAYSPAIRAQASSAEEYEKNMEALYRSTLDHLVDRALMITEFKTKGYQVPEKEVDAEYKRMLKEGYNDKVSDLIEALRAQGLTIPAYRERIKENLMVQALTERFRRELPAITPDQIVAYYNAHLPEFSEGGKLRLSAITLTPLADEPALVLEQTAETLREKLQHGADFYQLATEYSQESNFDWGELSLDELSEEVRTAVATLRSGEVSAPITLEGPKVLLVKVNSRTDQTVKPIEVVTEEIRKAIFEQRAQEAYEKWMKELRAKYFVKINSHSDQ